jgi:hypothetical protein
MPDPTKYAWQRIFEDGVSETDPGKLREKVMSAEAAIVAPAQTLQLADTDERHTLEYASRVLQTVKKEVLRFPDWNRESR